MTTIRDDLFETLSEGLRLSLEHIMNNPDLQVEDPDFDLFSDRVVEIMRKAEEQVAAL